MYLSALSPYDIPVLFGVSDVPAHAVFYVDEWRQYWRKRGSHFQDMNWIEGNGEWEIYSLPGVPRPFNEAGEWNTSDWQIGDPNDQLPYSVEPYRAYLTDALQRLGLGLYDGETGERKSDGPAVWNPNAITNPRWVRPLFTIGYNPFNQPANVNPYGSPDNARALRDFAHYVGLTDDDADQAALQAAQENFVTSGEPYSEASHPAIIGDNIARKLAKKAGVEYTGLTPEQRAEFAQNAALMQDDVKGHREAHEDAADWYQASQVISVFLPVISYAAGAAVGATAGAADSAATGASTATSTGVLGTGLTWSQIVQKAIEYVGKLATSQANKDVPALPKAPNTPDWFDYAQAQQQQAEQQHAAQAEIELQQLKAALADPKIQIGAALATFALFWKLSR